MLVYANRLHFHGEDAEEAILKAIGGWLKEQLGFGLHPGQLITVGQHNGNRNGSRSSLRIHSTDEDEPKLYAWILKNTDETVRGRQWITELGLKIYRGSSEFTCVLKTDELSTLVANPVSASRPRVISYILNNIRQANDADFAAGVIGQAVKVVGKDNDSYRGLLSEIERHDRDSPIVLVSPTRAGTYLLNVEHLQDTLVGLAQVIRISEDFNSYAMSGILGQHWSAWGGAVNILHIPTMDNFVRGRFFTSDVIEEWGETQHERVSRILAWVTNNTNIPRHRKRVQPEGVSQLALRRRLRKTLEKSDQLNAEQLREELREASEQSADHETYLNEIAEENSQLEAQVSELNDKLDIANEDLNKKEYNLQNIKDQLERAGGSRSTGLDAEFLFEMASSNASPSPLDCLEAIEKLYGGTCVVLQSAKKSARDMNRFLEGRRLLEILRRLVKEYRLALIEGGDNKARNIFGKNEYAANESETVTKNKSMRRARTFEYRGKQIEMFRHLKIGIDDDVTKTIRVHFYWDAQSGKIIIGYCGKHLPIPSC